MELVRGGSLQRSLRVGPFPLTRAAAYFDQMLKAMAFMHGDDGGLRRPIAHRDLKPSNILVLRHAAAPDVIKITDFGLAVEVDSLMGWVESGGDLAYLAPESFSHNICSPQSDVYMLGLVFYEMLTGHNPFSEVGQHLRGDDEAQRTELRRLHLAARQMETFPLLARHEEIRQRPELGHIIRTALQSDMNAREYKNAREFQRAWQQVKDGAIHSTPRPEKHWDTVRRLTGEADQAFAVGDYERGDTLLCRASEINRDARRVPDSMSVGRCYLLMVERLLKRGEVDEAGFLANEGYRRRRRRSTCLAMARYYQSQRSPVAAEFERQAQASPDQD
jgi:serine/threonine protein kinase